MGAFWQKIIIFFGSTVAGAIVLFFIQELFSYILNIIFSKADKKIPSILKLIQEKKKNLQFKRI